MLLLLLLLLLMVARAAAAVVVEMVQPVAGASAGPIRQWAVQTPRYSLFAIRYSLVISAVISGGAHWRRGITEGGAGQGRAEYG